MKSTGLYFTATLTIAAIFAGGILMGSESETKAGCNQSEDQMKAWVEFMTPAEQHKALDVFAGKWITTSKFWMAGPSSPPSVSEGTAETTWVLGGRFLQLNATGSMMGAPMQGIGHTGYDKAKKKYVSTWMDSMGTALYYNEGNMDPSGKVITAYGTVSNPMEGNRTMKYVSRIISKDEHVFEMYDMSGAEDGVKVMEITYKRLKG